MASRGRAAEDRRGDADEAPGRELAFEGDTGAGADAEGDTGAGAEGDTGAGLNRARRQDDEPTFVAAPHARRHRLDDADSRRGSEPEEEPDTGPTIDDRRELGSSPILLRAPMSNLETDPTQIDASGALLSTGRSLTSSGRSHSVVMLRDTLELEEVTRTRSFLALSALVASIILALLPLLGGHPVAKWMLAGSMAAVAISTLIWRWQLRDPAAYTPLRVSLVGGTCVVGAFCGVIFFGVFSPAAVVIPFGLFFFSLSQSARPTRVVFMFCAGGYLVAALALVVGAVPDPGLMTAAGVPRLDQLVAVAVTESLIVATYGVARLSRRATAQALEHHDRAVRVLAARDALLHEARLDLEGVLRARGLGRFTDEVVGGYRLGAIIGRGGMGEVYDAVHVDSEQAAAVKLLHPHLLQDPDGVRRFLRECHVASALDVPNVVRVWATSEPDDPIPYIAMERLRGQDLADILRARGRLKLRDVLRCVRQVGQGLDAAAAAGIVHRDIKPRNLFLAEEHPGARTWKILDFGVSKLATDATMTGQHVVGTPSYMAPEQASGRPVSHSADLYALGVIAYRALTGRPAFSGDGVSAILYQVVHQMPPRPSQVAKLSEDLDRVLAMALAKSPEDRFDSAAELADAIEVAAKGKLSRALRERGEQVMAKHPWDE